MAENRELAYRIYYECRPNIELTLRRIHEHPQGFPVTKPTLYEWMKTYRWEERATKQAAEAQRRSDTAASSEEAAIDSLDKVRRSLEVRILVMDPAVDAQYSQTAYAYTNVVKSLIDLKARSAAQKAALFLQFLGDLIEFFSKNDPDSVSVIERNLTTWPFSQGRSMPASSAKEKEFNGSWRPSAL
jgi:hypothetical protein